MSTTISYRQIDANKDQLSLTAYTTLTTSDSGNTILLDAIGEAILLPAPLAGINYKFVITDTIATSLWSLTSQSNYTLDRVL